MSGATTIEITTWDDHDDEVVLELPAKFEVCPRCSGKGSHVNPAVDGNGISPQEFAEDPDFEESYFRGDYDVACHRCDGNRVIKVVDRDRAKPEDLKIFDNQERELRELEAEEAAERRVGA